MNNLKQIEQQQSVDLELARLFEVEELEERVEFGKWKAEAKAECKSEWDPVYGEFKNGCSASGSVSYTIGE